MSTFQIILTGVFVVFIALGVLAFAIPGAFFGSSDRIGEVAIWGTVPERAVSEVLSTLSQESGEFEGVTYTQMNAANYEETLIEAFASGSGPDLFFLPQENALSFANKVTPVPFSQFSERTFKDSFVEEGELYLGASSVYGFPALVDPMVLYWNRDLFANAGVAKPPRFWDELLTLNPKLTVKDSRGGVSQSSVALGEMVNVDYGKDILALLFLQAGNPIVKETELGYDVTLVGADVPGAPDATESVLRFYTEFADPAKATYAWNRSLPSSQNAFISGKLAMYIGYASEIRGLRERNPNLNFDVAPIPQIRDMGVRMTFGQMLALAIPKSSDNPQGAYKVILSLTTPASLTILAETAGLPPVHRDLLSKAAPDAASGVFYDGALVARGWLDPNPVLTKGIFKTMVESVTSGRSSLSDALRNANSELTDLVR